MTKLIGYHKDMPMDEYQSAQGISNGGLQMIEKNPSKFAWIQNAPQDPTKSSAASFGTVTHTALIEPELFEGSFLIGPTKSRDTKAFIEFKGEHPDKLVLLESEYDQIRLTVDSAKADPTLTKYLSEMEFDPEASIFVDDPERPGVVRKIRIDVNYAEYGFNEIGDVKTTKDIEDWRSPLPWKNPLFAYGYGHTAAYYLDTASLHYGRSIDVYTFILIQKTAEFGRYPVEVFSITREELEMYGFFDQMNANLDEYEERKNADDWVSVSRFPVFNIPAGEATFEYVDEDGDNNE